MKEEIVNYTRQLLFEILLTDTNYILLATLVVLCIIFLDSLTAHINKTKTATGFSAKSKTVSVDGAKSLEVRTYVSDIQGLAGTPDAIIIENGYMIPVERKPLAKKIRDRYIAQILVYMRLVEEFEGKKPPYGYLILGANCRRVKIENSPEKQAWLQKIIDEMNGVLNGKEAIASPHVKKCSKCDVRALCEKGYSRQTITHKSELLAKRA